MPNKFLFADEAGCFTFEKRQHVSRYFILCTVAMEDDTVGSALLTLRRKLAWNKAELADYCAWALQRKYESGGKDCRSYDLIANRITYEYDLWERGNRHYY
jgi:hypothetical protein